MQVVSTKIRTANSAVRFHSRLGSKNFGLVAAKELIDETVISTDESHIVECVIYLCKPDLRLTPVQITTLLQTHPRLVEHACRQQGVGRFGDKIQAASLPHIVEHLTIDMIVASFGFQVAGNTTWQDRPKGLAKIMLVLPGSPKQDFVSIQDYYQKLIEEAVIELNKLLNLDKTT